MGLVIFPIFFLILGTQVLPVPWPHPFSLRNPLWAKWLIFLGTQILLWGIIMRGVYSVNSVARNFFGLMLWITVLVTGVFSFLHKSPQLALFCFLLSIVGVLFWILIKKEYQRTYFRHGKKWFQGKAETIPHLHAKVSLDQRTNGSGIEVEIVGLSNDGFFGFCESKDWSALVEKRNVALKIKGALALSDRKEKNPSSPFLFEGDVCASLDEDKNQKWVGFGVYFKHNPEQNMRVGDLIEILRSRGYVQNN